MTTLSPVLQDNVALITKTFGNSSDLVVRYVPEVPGSSARAALIYIDGIVDTELVAEAVLKRALEIQDAGGEMGRTLDGTAASPGSVSETDVLERVSQELCEGACVLLTQDRPDALIFRIPQWPGRAIEEPLTEPTVRGPKEGFTENLRTNTSLLRKRIRSPQLRIDEVTLGRLTRTRVAVVYIASLVSPDVLREVKRRLSLVDVDGIQESGQLEELIEDHRMSPFPTMLRTERVDRAVGNLLEGRIVIITDGTPFALIVPATFAMFLSTPEDYFERFFMGSFLRLARFVAFVISVTLSSLYVAITTFHQEMIPHRLLWSIAAQREGVPFPALVEALVMEFTFEILREAGLRLPPIVGQTVSIIGVLVVGDAAIRAGLVSPAMVVVLASSGIASFAAPTFSIGISARVLRFGMIVLGGTMGLFGVVSGLYLLFLHLSTLRSFGVPYLEPVAPFVLRDMKDMVFRFPWWAMRERPSLVGTRNLTRASHVPGTEKKERG